MAERGKRPAPTVNPEPSEEELPPSVGTLLEQLLARVVALEAEVDRLNARVADLEAATLMPPEKH